MTNSEQTANDNHLVSELRDLVVCPLLLVAGESTAGNSGNVRAAVEELSRGFFPVMPHSNRCSPSSVRPARRSTQVNASRNKGSFTFAGAPGKSTGIIGTMLPIFFSLTKRRQRACISGSSHGPTPESPKQTKADLHSVTISWSASCQVSPGRNSHSSSQTERFRCLSAAPSTFTVGLSRPLWLRNTSNCT